VAVALAGIVAILALQPDSTVLAFAQSMRHVVTR
jgi:hypothetical protein